MTSELAVFFDPDLLEQEIERGFFETRASAYLPVLESHPENNDRIRNMEAILRRGPLASHLSWHRGAAASIGDLRRFHEPAYVEALAAIPADESRELSATTWLGKAGFERCQKAAGQVVAAARHVFEDQGKTAYALVRPPGHHAQTDRADGYCIFNNIGVAIEDLRARGLKRAAVIDWDVHHGNGTQQGFYRDADILTISMHMDHGAWGPSHVQTGAIEEWGEDSAAGKNLNIPMPFGSGDGAYARVFDELIMPAVKRHRPEMLVVAAGQDANQFDPNGRQLLSMRGFYQLGDKTRQLAGDCCDGRLLLVQEGGYAISYAAYCLHATLAGALGVAMDLEDPLAYMRDDAIDVGILIDTIRKRHPDFANR